MSYCWGPYISIGDSGVFVVVLGVLEGIVGMLNWVLWLGGGSRGSPAK